MYTLVAPSLSKKVMKAKSVEIIIILGKTAILP